MNEESGFLKVPVAGETLYKITLLSTNEAFHVLFGAKFWQLSNTVRPCMNCKILMYNKHCIYVIQIMYVLNSP